MGDMDMSHSLSSLPPLGEPPTVDLDLSLNSNYSASPGESPSGNTAVCVHASTLPGHRKLSAHVLKCHLSLHFKYQGGQKCCCFGKVVLKIMYLSCDWVSYLGVCRLCGMIISTYLDKEKNRPVKLRSSRTTHSLLTSCCDKPVSFTLHVTHTNVRPSLAS